MDRYGEFSPEIAQAQAMAEINQTLGDMERAQRVGNDLARYVEQRSRLQQNIEDLKVDLLKAILPAVEDTLKMLVKMQPALEGGMSLLTKHLERVNTVISFVYEAVAKIAMIKVKETSDRETKVKDPTEEFLNSPEFREGGDYVPPV